MQPFDLVAVRSVPEAVATKPEFSAAQAGAPVRLIAGGTNLVDYMKLNVMTPRRLVDINALPLRAIEPLPEGGLRIGALATNSEVAHHERVKESYPVLAEALLSGATVQLRNMATTGGNLLQKTRCVYYRDTAWGCNKREPGTGCSALGGHNRGLAILGTSERCIASNPSDQNVALAALDATIHVQGAKGERAIPIAQFYLKPGETPERETVLEPGDVITHVTMPALPEGARSVYLKLRDRASYEFALASAAVVVGQTGGRISFARVALGGVGTVPWRATEAEHMLEGKAATPANFRAAAEAALRGARPQSQNGFKVELAKRCLAHALAQATTTATAQAQA